MSDNKIIYYAIGVYKGGGLTILKNFIKHKQNSFFYLDSRLNPIHYKNIKNYKLIRPNILNLLFTQYYLSKKENSFFFINGIPPIFNFRKKIYVLFQNSNIIPNFNFSYIIKWLFSKDFLRFLIFFFSKNKVDSWVVVSEVAHKILQKYVKIYIPIVKLFIYSFDIKKNYSKKIYDFIYPADYKKHKNHKYLILAFLKLAKKGIKPSILLTLTDDELIKIGFKNLEGKINIYNFCDYNNQKKFLRIMRQTKCLLYPSINETLALPIIEAYKNKLDIICSNLFYAKQFITPNYTFNPYSVTSISNAIKKYYFSKKKNKSINHFVSEYFLSKKMFFNNFLK